MLRLTTKVATSPARRARSSSAAARISSTASGRVSANSAVSSAGLSSRPSSPRSTARRTGSPGPIAGAPLPFVAAGNASPPGQEGREPLGEHVEDAGIEPLPVHVLRVDAEPLGQRVAAGTQPLADLKRAREGMLGRDVVAVGREAAEVGGARLDEVEPPAGEVRRHLDADLRHQPPALGDEPRHLLQRHRRGPIGQRGVCCLLPAASVSSPLPLARLGGDVGYLRPVVARMGNEVLEDHLLDVAVTSLQLSERLERGDPLLLALADPDEDAARERDSQLAGRRDRVEPDPRVLGRRSGVDRLHQPLADRLQHQSLRGGHLAEPPVVLAACDADVRVREDPPRQRLLAGPADVGGEVVVAPAAEPLGDERVDLRTLAGEDEQLLDVADGGRVEPLDHGLGRMDVSLVGRERAVLAVAAAGPRERERQVAREGDAPHRPHANEAGCPAGGRTPR